MKYSPQHRSLIKPFPQTTRKPKKSECYASWGSTHSRVSDPLYPARSIQIHLENPGMHTGSPLIYPARSSHLRKNPRGCTHDLPWYTPRHPYIHLRTNPPGCTQDSPLATTARSPTFFPVRPFRVWCHRLPPAPRTCVLPGGAPGRRSRKAFRSTGHGARARGAKRSPESPMRLKKSTVLLGPRLA